MNLLRKAFSVLVIIAAAMAAMSFIASKHSAKTKLVIQFENFVGNNSMQLDTEIYKNEFGQKYSISKFKYYIGNIHLKRKDGTEYISSDYFLVNEEEKNSKQITLNDVPAGEFVAINFILGVDSAHNCSGAQSGALDPMNGMFWAWNTGYIFLTLEGHSTASSSMAHLIEFHIGGYKQPNNCIRKVNLSFTKPGAVSSITIKADASAIFKLPTAIDFSKLSSVSDFHNATAIADNYTNMFSVLKIE